MFLGLLKGGGLRIQGRGSLNDISQTIGFITPPTHPWCKLNDSSRHSTKFFLFLSVVSLVSLPQELTNLGLSWSWHLSNLKP